MNIGKAFTYLDPYKPNLVIGLGRSNGSGGLTISLIDVTNAYDTRELSSFSLDEKYLQSAALQEHKAFLTDKRYEKLVIPAGLNTVATSRFNGAFVMNLKNNQIANDFIIDHLISANDQFTDRTVERSLYIANFLYTKSPCLIRVHDLATGRGVRDIPIPCKSSDVVSFRP